MRCPNCNGVTAVSHSNAVHKAQYRRRFCTNLECQLVFPTWETTVNPNERKPHKRPSPE